KEWWALAAAGTRHSAATAIARANMARLSRWLFSTLASAPRLIERDAGLVLGGADGQRGLDAGDVGRGRKLAGEEFLEALQVLADDLEDEVDLAVEHVALAHLGQALDVILERLEVFLRLALEADHREHGDGEAQARGVEIGMIAANHARFLERADAAQAGRRGQSHAAGEIDVG